LKRLVIIDILIVENGVVPADIVILSGDCAVDESSLTGEGMSRYLDLFS